MATNKDNSIDTNNVNTTGDIFKDSKAKDADLSAKAMATNKALVKHKRVKFKCSAVYAALYPNGFESTCQGIHIYLIFDGREVTLPEFIAKYVQNKIEKKAMAMLDKKTRNATKKQDYLGMNYAE
jgi:hypothetical protein